MPRTLALALVVFIAFNARAQNLVEGDLGAALDRAVELVDYGGFRGCVLVSRDGEILLAKGYRLASPSAGPITADSLLELASVTKAFTAAAILRLEEQGKLTTDDLISRHLDDVPNDKRNITIHHLLTHTSGIAHPQARFPADEREAVIRVLLSGPVESPPGMAYSYSNAGYWLLAAIIERVSGQRFEDYVREEVLRRAGMKSSACQTDPALDLSRCVDRVVDGQRVGSAGECPYPFVWGYRGSGGVVASARDMFAWDQALRSGTFLPAAARARMFTPVLNGYAYGWEISEGLLGRIASHTGGVAGFLVSFTRFLDRDACVLVITNAPGDPAALSRDLTELLFPETAERVRATLRPSAVELGEFGAGVLPPTAGFDVGPSGDGGVTVQFIARGNKAPPLEIELSRAAAARVSRELSSCAEAILADEAAAPVPPMVVEIYTAVYRDRAEPILVDGDEVIAKVMPGTPHPEEGGELRVSLIVIDPANMFWPVIAKFNASRAKELGTEIARALGE